MTENLTETETSTTSSNISILLGIGTATILGLTLMQGADIPQHIKFSPKQPIAGLFWDKYFDQSYYQIVESDPSLEKSRIILSFGQKIIDSSVDLDEKVVSLVDERFWDLI